MRLLLPLAVPVLLAACSAPESDGAAGADAEAGWIQLFDGRSLDGWTPKFVGHDAGVDPWNTFRVEDGLLTVSYDDYDAFAGRFGHLFHAGLFTHYRLRAEYRFVGSGPPDQPGWAYRNNGLMLHGQTPETMGRDQAFPVSIEVQLLGADDTGERPTANLCTPGTHVVMGDELVTRHCTNSTSPSMRGDRWVTVEVLVRGDAEVVHLVEGEEVMRYGALQLDPNDADARRLLDAGAPVVLAGGTISIQAESAPIQFRTIELLPLEPR